LTALEVIKLLGLSEHPTCGFYRQTYVTGDTVPEGILKRAFRGRRPLGSVLYFLITPDAKLQFHRVIADQMYQHYMGEPVEVLLLFPDGTGAVEHVGSDLMQGMRPQLLIPGGTFHISRLKAATGYALLGTTEWGGVYPDELETASPEALVRAFPSFAQAIRSFTTK
jgi:uncharacterized protein